VTKQELISQIHQKKSFLCVGLDTDIEQLPQHFSKSAQGMLDFNKAIIDATQDYAVSYKINTAFYESIGSKGWEVMEKTLDYIPNSFFTIADAKRGDIGNTSAMYARAFLQNMQFDSITVAPYMGEDSVVPFLSVKDKWVILLALTSNQGSNDFQQLVINGEELYMHVVKKAQQWTTSENIMFVVGATRGSNIAEIRKLAPKHFFLVPGVGAQGGNLKEVFEYGKNEDCGLLINSSRAIIYASTGRDFQEKAALEAKKNQLEMAELLKTL
jgi:orotidine-5'-phosphate decarboxylase